MNQSLQDSGLWRWLRAELWVLLSDPPGRTDAEAEAPLLRPPDAKS